MAERLATCGLQSRICSLLRRGPHSGCHWRGICPPAGSETTTIEPSAAPSEGLKMIRFLLSSGSAVAFALALPVSAEADEPKLPLADPSRALIASSTNCPTWTVRTRATPAATAARHSPDGTE